MISFALGVFTLESTAIASRPDDLPRHLRRDLPQAGAMQGPASTPPAPTPITVDELVASFLAGTLPRDSWTHPAHLFVCRHLLQTASADEVLEQLRVLIPAHNTRVGVLPYHGGYHETVTRYFVEAVATTAPATTAELLAAPACQREAPLRHWSPEILRAPQARRAWVPPDRAPLPWSTDTSSTDTCSTDT
ncbi:MAG: hypothetical protein JWO77_2424 [Ilumatobacteraceae bacterium]|nr:hypothetical protein [Ilumatobacteraceae bacterium]